MLHKVSEQVGEPFDGYARFIFNTIFEASRSCQNNYWAKESDLAQEISEALENTPKLFPNKAVVACQGVPGAYSQAACEKLFEVPSIMYFNSFEGVFNAVEKGLCRYGILPIENSSYGSVGAVYDLMQNYNFHIVKASVCASATISWQRQAPSFPMSERSSLTSRPSASAENSSRASRT